MGVNVQTNLKSGPHCTAIVSKASACCRLILKSLLSRNPFILARAFVFNIGLRPILEYCAPAWSPYFMQDIDLIEGVQRTFTRNLYRYCHLEHVTYDERLHFLGLQRLELWRIHIDLIYMFKLTHITYSLPLCHNRCNLLIMHTLLEAISKNLQLRDVIKLFLAIILLIELPLCGIFYLTFVLLLIHYSLSKINCIF